MGGRRFQLRDLRRRCEGPTSARADVWRGGWWRVRVIAVATTAVGVAGVAVGVHGLR